MIPPEKFREASAGGLVLRRDPEAHQALGQRVRMWLASQREWTALGNPNVIADHLSDFLHCLRKSELRRREWQAALVRGAQPWDFDNLSDDDLVFFGVGYAFQHGMFGAVEESVWDGGLQMWYSPDAVRGTRLFEAKTVRASPIKKADEAAGLSVEDVLLRDRAAWWKYALATMKLAGERRVVFAVLWVISGEWQTFELLASAEAIQRNWDDVAARMAVLRGARSVGQLPPLSSRVDRAECERCPYRVLEPCFSELAREAK